MENVVAGIDTSSNTASMLLYNLAKTPEAKKAALETFKPIQK